MTNNLNSFLSRFLTYRERTHFQKRFCNDDGDVDWEGGVVSDAMLQWLGGRWAAKEATIKAASPRGQLSFKHIMILNRPIPPGQAALGVYGIILDRPASAFLCNDSGRISFDSTKKSWDGAIAEQSWNNGMDNRSKWNLNKDSDLLSSNRDLIPGEEQFSNLSGQIVHVNISHEKDYAVAVCLAPIESGPGDVGGEAAAPEPSADIME